jgi:hypothetical protein
VLFSVNGLSGAEFQSGAAIQNFTPDPPMTVSGGVGEPKGDLTARVMVFSDGDTTITVVDIDRLVFPSVPGDRVRKMVSRRPDCIGPMCDRLAERPGGIAMFMNGAQGGMITADNRDRSKAGDIRTSL